MINIEIHALYLINNAFVSLLQTEQSYKRNPKALDQFQYCEQNGIPLAIIIGQSEIENNFVKLRNVVNREEVCSLLLCSDSTLLIRT